MTERETLMKEKVELTERLQTRRDLIKAYEEHIKGLKKECEDIISKLDDIERALEKLA